MKKNTQRPIHIYPHAVFMLLVLPLLNAVLNPVYAAVSGDVLLIVWANILSCIMYAVTTVTLYAGLGYSVLALVRGLNPVPYIVMYGVGLVLFYAGGIVSDRIYMTDKLFSEMLGLTLSTDLLNIGVEALMFAVTLLLVNMHITRRGRSMFPAKNPFARDKANIPALIPVLVCFVNSFVWAAASTIVDIVTVGLPINLTEVVYLLSPYGLILLCAAVGYFTVRRVLFSKPVKNVGK